MSDHNIIPSFSDTISSYHNNTDLFMSNSDSNTKENVSKIEDKSFDNDITLDVVENDDNFDVASLLRESTSSEYVILPTKSSMKKKRLSSIQWGSRSNRTKHKIPKKETKWNRTYNNDDDSDYEEEISEDEEDEKPKLLDMSNVTVLNQTMEDDDLDIDVVNFDLENDDIPVSNEKALSSDDEEGDDMYIESNMDQGYSKKKRKTVKNEKKIVFIPYKTKIKIVNKTLKEDLRGLENSNLKNGHINETVNIVVDSGLPTELPQTNFIRTVYKKVKHEEFTNEDINAFYDSLKPSSQESIQPKEMTTNLFPYQKRAVAWMVKMEKSDIRGGILADEMGLGKSVEVLGTILHNNIDPLNFSGQKNILPATLIICPSFLIRQWKIEIKKHSSNLNAWVYKGVRKLSEKWRYLHERNINIFKGRDVVISSFEVLCKDLNYTLSRCVNTRRSLNGLESNKITSPLIQHNWWRVCIDEAQMHSNTTTKTAKMLLKIPAIHRWVVSGTPIKRGFNDLKGLISFLGCEDQWYQDTKDLKQFLKTIMWRHSKSQVIDDVSILETIEHNEQVHFSELELFCNARLQAKLKMDEVDNIDNIASTKEGRFSSVPHSTLCQYYFNHKGNSSSFNIQKVIISLTNMIASEFYQSQISLGQSLNQFGDYLLLKEKYEESIKVYQLSYDLNQYNTLSTIYKQLIQLKTSSFVLSPPQSTVSSVCYHAIKNMRIAHEKLGHTKEKDHYMKLEIGLKKSALQGVQNSYLRFREHFKKIKREMSRMIRNRNMYDREPWYVTSLNYFTVHKPEFFEKLRKGVQQQYDTKFHGLRTSILQLNVFNAEEIIDLLDRELKKMYSSRERSVEAILKDVVIEEIVLNNNVDNIEESEKLLNEYEMSLASLVEVQNALGEFQMRGELNIAERILLYIEYMTILEYNPLMKEYTSNTLPQEYFGSLNKLSFALLMAESHFRELEVMKLEVDRGDKLLKEKSRYIKAITDLYSSSTAKLSSSDVLKENLRKNTLALLEKKSQLEFIVNEGTKNVETLDQYGSKLGQASRILQNILIGPNSDPKEKALVFSAWTEPLVQLSYLLDFLGIKYRFGQDAGNSGKPVGSLKDRIEAFKSQDDIRVLFLNSLSQSTGLTLTQANHVLILDPIDPSSEKQAIGRAYRIGQQKNTHIYRFSTVDRNIDITSNGIPEEIISLLPLDTE